MIDICVFISYTLSEVIGMTSETGGILVEKEKLVEILGAFQWCSSSQDFQLDGQARLGWEKTVEPLIGQLKDKIEQIELGEKVLDQFKSLGKHPCS